MSEEIEVLTLTQIKKLKVAELRERLQSLGKPTTGLKPDLVERLFQALFEAQKKEALKSNLAAAYPDVGGNVSSSPQTAAEPDAVSEVPVSEEPAMVAKNSSETKDSPQLVEEAVKEVAPVEQQPVEIEPPISTEGKDSEDTKEVLKKEASKGDLPDLAAANSDMNSVPQTITEPVVASQVPVSEEPATMVKDNSETQDSTQLVTEAAKDLEPIEQQPVVIEPPVSKEDKDSTETDEAQSTSNSDLAAAYSNTSSSPQTVSEPVDVSQVPVSEEPAIITKDNSETETKDSPQLVAEAVNKVTPVEQQPVVTEPPMTHDTDSKSTIEDVDTSLDSQSAAENVSEKPVEVEAPVVVEPVVADEVKKEEIVHDKTPVVEEIKMETVTEEEEKRTTIVEAVKETTPTEEKEEKRTQVVEDSKERSKSVCEPSRSETRSERSSSLRERSSRRETLSTEEKDSKDSKETPKPPKERKRRWGSSLSTNNSGAPIPKTTKGISSDAIKELIPDLNKSNAQVSNKTDDIKKDIKITPTNTTLQNSTNVSGIGQSNSGTTANHGTNGIKTVDKRLQKSISVNEELGKQQHQQQHEEEKPLGRRLSTPALVSKDGKDDEAMETTKRAPSPAHNPPTNIVFIRNLVRPFTILQLKEILGKTGKLNEEKFWIDKIKSKCYVTYKSQEEAVASRDALHGLRWPDANPKTLIADFATEDELDYHLNLEKGIVPPKPTVETPKPETKRQPEITKPTSKDKYDIIIRREKHDGQGDVQTEKSEDKKDTRKDKREDVNKDKRPIREWDREKFLRKSDGDNACPVKKRRSASRSVSPRRGDETRSRDKDKNRELKSDQKQKEKAQENESPANLLDGLFKKTKATPCIYWLPLTEDQAKKRAEDKIETERRRNEERIARENERRKQMEEMNRARRPSPPVRRTNISPGRRGARGSYASRRPPPRFRGRRDRSDSGSESSSRSRSRSRSRGRSGRSISRSRSRSRSPPSRKGPPPRRSRTRSRSLRRSPRRR